MKSLHFALFALVGLALAGPVRADSEHIEFTRETLPNGLQVIYAPLRQAPVVHVRVIYHVGSKDERPDRQGFAHMFEHMMFRGSAHVAPEEHMKLVGIVGGYSNAFTSFDQTVYHETLPSEALDMALYLEADRMASFKVSENIFKTERNVVAEEWRMRQNRPYGNEFEDFARLAFAQHSYRWTPIGNMDHLRAARVNELQDFFNTYYLPNNATLVIAGDIDVNKARQSVERYFGWIPRGANPPRNAAAEPPQTRPRQETVGYRVPLPAVMIGYKLPPYRSADHDALGLLADVLGGGRASRLQRLLVDSARPQAVEVQASEMRLEDAGLFLVGATVMQGRSADEVEKVLASAVADVVANGVTPEELDRVRTQERIGLIHARENATNLASQLGEEAVFGGDADRVNTELQRLNAVTVDDVRRVAREYLKPESATTLRINPDPLGKSARAAATQAAMNTPVPPATAPVKTRDIVFPEKYPTHATAPQITTAAHFEKGEEFDADGVHVIVMHDARLPLVSWSLTTRNGSDADPAGMEGLSGLTDLMLRRGSAGASYEQLNRDLESRGIEIDVADGGDFTRLSGSCVTDQLAHAIARSRQILFSPDFPQAEFDKLKQQRENELALSLENPTTVATDDLAAALYGSASPLGRTASPQSIDRVSLDDVKRCYRRHLQTAGALLVFSGDVTLDQARDLAGKMLGGWPADAKDASGTTVDYPAPAAPARRRIILVDRPGGKQSTIRMGIPAYDLHNDEKFAGSVASHILTSGIDSRLGRYVRAEKGLAYSVHGVFQPGRHGGAFVAGVDTAIEHTADAIEAMFHVLDETQTAGVTPDELAQAKTRVSGGMLMGMQTIQQQAVFRTDAVLNGYPVDYYDVYPSRINAVTAAQVKDVLARYVHDDRMAIVVVAPAADTLEQLKRLGDVVVVPMPAKREGATTRPSGELLKPAA